MVADKTRQDLQYNNISYNNNIIITISQYIEKPGKVRTVYLGIFRYTQRYSAIFSHVQAY